MTDTSTPRSPWQAPALAVLATYVATVAVGLFFGSVLMAGSSERGMEGLGQAIVALFVGFTAALITFIVVGVLTMRRALPAGRRAPAITVLMLSPVLQYLVLEPFPSLSQTPARLIAAPAYLLVAALPWLLVLLVTGRFPARITLAWVVVAGVSIAVAIPVEAASRRTALIAGLQESGLPLPLFDGTSTAAEGWEFYYVPSPYRGVREMHISLTSQEQRNATLLLGADAPEPCGKRPWLTCRQIGTSAYGPVTEQTSSGSTPVVWVEVAGGYWKISGMDSGEEAARVLRMLRPVDATTFADAAY